MKSHPVYEKRRIFAPGPTPVPSEVLSAMSVETLHHRTKEFTKILGRTRENLQFLFQTKQPAYFFTSSGTGAMEASVVNLFAHNDKILAINGGKFGERWGEIAEAYGLNVVWMEVEWGHSAEPDELTKLLKKHSDIKGVLFQASETSTGALHPVKEIASAVHQNSEALVIVDAISALGVTPLPLDEWGLDAVIGGSQKALMLPPGLAFLALSEKAQKSRARSDLPRFYYNLKEEDKAMEKGQTAFTPAVNLICALDEVLQKFREAGLENIFKFHERLAQATRRGVTALNLELFAKDTPSPSVTSVQVPKEIGDGKKIVSHLRERYGITVAGGQSQLTGKIFRIAHLGYYDELDMLTILSGLELTLRTLGYPCELGKGVASASSFFLENN